MLLNIIKTSLYPRDCFDIMLQNKYISESILLKKNIMLINKFILFNFIK